MDTVDTAGNKETDVFDIIVDKMTEFRSEMEYYDEIGLRIANKTRFIMRVVFFTLIISLIFLVYMIYQMSNNMTVMTSHLEDMYSNFGIMSQEMHAITHTVDSMGRNVTGMPVIAQSMASMRKDVRAMNHSLNLMNQSVHGMDSDVFKINSSMQKMNWSLYNMNQSVYRMGYDVNEMSQPADSAPFSGFWPD